VSISGFKKSGSGVFEELVVAVGVGGGGLGFGGGVHGNRVICALGFRGKGAASLRPYELMVERN
jgi:hypothetical protein